MPFHRSRPGPELAKKDERQATADPRQTLKIASIIVLAFASVLILFGLNVFQVGIKEAKTAQDLQTSGLAGTVVDARTLVSRVADGELHALRVEVTFMDVGGAGLSKQDSV